MNDVRLFSEMSAAYNSRFYPGAVKYADELKKNWPHSALIPRTLVYEGECLFMLGRYAESAAVLNQALPLVSGEHILAASCWYWNGRTAFEQKGYEASAAAFYQACSILKNIAEDGERSAQYYNSSVLYAGRSCMYLEKYDAAVPLFEYVIAHGTLYTHTEYAESAFDLFKSYSMTKQYKKILALYPQLNAIEQPVYDSLTLYAGDAEAATGDYRSAYDLYCKTLVSGTPAASVQALAKAYAVSTAHKDAVGREPGDVFEQAQKKLTDYPELVAEFWVRLGIDAYNSGDDAKAVQYFDSVAASAPARLKRTAALYRAEIILQQARNPASGAPDALKLLNAAAADTGLQMTDDEYTVFQSRCARYAGLGGDWKKCRIYAASVKNPDPDTKYWQALSAYNLGQYTEAADILGTEGMSLHADSGRLYARALAKSGRTQDALSAFSTLDKKNSLDSSSYLDYAKLLLISGKSSQAYAEARKSSDVQALYVAGLAEFNSRNWKNASELFSGYMAAGKNDYRDFALFYNGYARYCSGDFSAAYKNLTEYISSYSDHDLVWNAQITAAEAAVQLKQFDNAAVYAEKSVKTAASEDNRQKAVLLTAGIYSDSQKYDKALAVLAPYTANKDDFGLKCRYETAQILSKKGDTAQADAMYKGVVADFSTDPLAEESMYRRGELFYGAGNYAAASERFDEYEKQYPKGTYTDAALYFGADCLARTGDSQRAILQYTLLLKTSSSDTYRYSSMKNVAALYRSTGDYNSALSTLKSLKKEYAKQADTDGVQKQIAELEQLASGTDERIVTKLAEYKKAGTYTSEEGRNAGTELAALYAESPATQGNAAALAEKILPYQQKNIKTECSYAARNAALLGSYYRQNGRYADGASKYLSAAEYARMSGDASGAASALYGAVDAFDAAGMFNDSKETAKLLDSLYPDSRQNTAAKIIISRY